MKFDWNQFITVCSKGMFLVLNGFCVATATCVFAFGVADTNIMKKYGAEHGTGNFIGDMVLITISLLLIIVATFGCVGMLKKNVKMMYLYVGLVMIAMILEMLISVYMAVQRYGLQARVTEWLREDFFRNVTEEEHEIHSQLWDKLQVDYRCCGLNGPEDYNAIQQEISLSCCPRAYRARTTFAQKQLYKSCLESATYQSDGCEDSILDILKDDADWLVGSALMVFWLETLGIFLAMRYASHVKNSVQVYNETVKY